MPRRPRIEQIGFHHVINRGVARGNIFLRDEDYEKFLEIALEAKKRYDFVIHSLSLMNNHYHLLIETKHENLSLAARQINSKYAQYFNKEYKRVGPLWQGRFKSIYVYDEKYLYLLAKYIEQNPIRAVLVKEIGKYRWCASSFLLNGEHKELFDDSMLHEKNIFLLLHNAISEDELENLNKLEKTKYTQNQNNIVRMKQKKLEEYFSKIENIKDRNNKIKEAVLDGYKQSEIARFLTVSGTTISKAVRHV